jgi:hypothetical protein
MCILKQLINIKNNFAYLNKILIFLYIQFETLNCFTIINVYCKINKYVYIFLIIFVSTNNYGNY